MEEYSVGSKGREFWHSCLLLFVAGTSMWDATG